MDTDLLEAWTVTLNSPWSSANDKFSNEFENFEEGNDFTYKREVTGYEFITGIIYTTEQDEEVAKLRLDKLFNEIQEKFNSKNESF